MKKTNVILLSLLLTGVFLTSTLVVERQVFASGGGGSSDGDGGGGGDASSGTYGNYAIGKNVFFDKLYCGDCPLGDLVLDQSSVEAILPELSSKGSLGKDLSYRERYAVKHFLKKRFSIGKRKSKLKVATDDQ